MFLSLWEALRSSESSSSLPLLIFSIFVSRKISLGFVLLRSDTDDSIFKLLKTMRAGLSWEEPFLRPGRFPVIVAPTLQSTVELAISMLLASDAMNRGMKNIGANLFEWSISSATSLQQGSDSKLNTPPPFFPLYVSKQKEIFLLSFAVAATRRTHSKGRSGPP